ncbi:MAG: hypothetical protein AWU59_87 [Methanolobus sp. T82-4]|nr:MAG: hypothetical protein AWU59_87 [Methanolobus sp. T82-4]
MQDAAGIANKGPIRKKSPKDLRNIIITLVLVLFLLSSIPAVTCAEDELLLNGTGIFLTTGESWSFDQGYQLRVKSVNPANDRVWVELSLNGEILHEGILGEGESLVYSHNREILNITMDTIYTSPSGELVTFKPVYQYLDPALPEPEVNEDTEDNQSQDDMAGDQSEDNSRSIPGFGIMIASIVLTTVKYYLDRKGRDKK